jgi:hypothetical protein
MKLLSVRGGRLEVLCEGEEYFLQSDSRWSLGRGAVYLPTTPPPGREGTSWAACTSTEAEGEELLRTWACHPLLWEAWRAALLLSLQESISTFLRIHTPSSSVVPTVARAPVPESLPPEQLPPPEDAIPLQTGPINVARAATLLGLSVYTVRRMLNVRPAQVHAGSRKRCHSRWLNQDGLIKWNAAVRAATEKPTPDEQPAPVARRKKGRGRAAQAVPVDFNALGRELSGRSRSR